MNAVRLLLRIAGKRLPITRGELTVEGPEAVVEIRRDRFGVPHVAAGGDADAWFALGFCHGQDRPFQIEVFQRLVRGSTAALIGAQGLPIDRLTRRLGLHRFGRRQVELLAPDHRRSAEAYAAGVTEGRTTGLPRRSHAHLLLRARPGRYEAADAFGFLALQAFLLAANWDTELARLMLVRGDGPEAAAALDPTYPEWQPTSARPAEPAGDLSATVAALVEDLAALAEVTGSGGGSNNWALSPCRTSTGRPILANDPHLAPLLPPHWYLVHLVTPGWSLVGASLPGAPAVAVGHNGRAAWGVTASQIDYTDLFLEEVGPDGRSVRRGDRYVACEVIPETIEVRGGDDERIEVLVTDRGPIIGPALEGAPAVSLSATWLRPAPAGALFEFGRIDSFARLRECFSGWSGLSLNVAYADAGGAIGWQLIGAAPRRRSGSGAVPLPAWEEATAWHPDPVPFDDMPHLEDPDTGYLATANNAPSTEGPFLGHDFLDGYRMARITEMLAARDDWDVPSTMRMQLDRACLPWREVREDVLAAARRAGDLGDAVDLLRDWDGVLSPESAAGTLFETFLGVITRRIAEAKAPAASQWALGRGFTPLVPRSMFLLKRTSHTVRLVREKPDGWFPEGWDEAIRDALRTAHRRLVDARGPDPDGWRWGDVRPLTLRHPLGARRPLERVYNLGPFPYGGDANTVNPAPVDPEDPTVSPDVAIASLRMVVDVGRWEQSRFALPGGQSGNPFSRHYDDQLDLWRKGDGLPIAWSESEVRRSTRATLVLRPPA